MTNRQNKQHFPLKILQKYEGYVNVNTSKIQYLSKVLTKIPIFRFDS